MKKIILCSALLCFALASLDSSGQITNPVEATENKAKDRVNGRIDQSIDNGLNSVEEGIGNIFKKKKKKPKEDATEQKEENTSENKSVNNRSTAQEPTLKAYSRFDFVSGAQTVYVEDFAQEAIGDFPANWETNASAEVVTLGKSSQKWFYMNANGWYSPESIKQLPENFTLEMDVYMNYVHWWGISYGIAFIAPYDDGSPIDFRKSMGQASAIFTFSPRDGSKTCTFQVYKDNQLVIDNQEVPSPGFSAVNAQGDPLGTKVHLSFWRQKNRLRVYANDQKIIDNPSAFKPATPYSKLVFNTFDMDKDDKGQMDQFMITNLRLAIGAPDTRNKLITEGKLVSRGIQFETNSSVIKPESYGTLKDIAQVLVENPSVKVKVVGHTDNVGNSQANVELSLKRAQSVIQALTEEFKVSSAQLIADGKGANEPVGPNTTPLGKAQNRRVEFIKL